MKTLFSIIVLMLGSTTLFSQSSESLKARIQEHYKAIHSGSETVWSHHLDEFTIFPSNGQALYESGFQKTYENMGATMNLPKPNVIMKHFSSQIYGTVGIATFYLDGSYGENHGLYRVTAVWVYKDGVWMEAHHHESILIN